MKLRAGQALGTIYFYGIDFISVASLILQDRSILLLDMELGVLVKGKVLESGIK